MKGQKIGYKRVSTVDQNAERQLEGIELDRVFSEQASGKDTNRPQLQACMAYLREGDALLIHSMDRLARNVEDMLRIVRELNNKGVTVQFMKENMVFAAHSEDPRSVLMMTMLTAFAQFERSLIRERQREGIAIAKAKGKYKGRKPALSADQVLTMKERVESGVAKAKVAREFKISRETLYQYLKAA